MGKIVHLNEVKELIGKTPAFRARDIEIIVKDRGYPLLLLHNLAKRGDIHRVTKGWYSRLEDPIVSVYAFKPAYLGLQEALGIHGLWEQETNVTLVTPRLVRRGVRQIMGCRVLVRSIAKERFFGFEYVRYDGLVVPVSDVDKTLIDLVYFGETPDKEVIAEIRKRSLTERVELYLRKYPLHVRRRVNALLRQGRTGA